MGIDDITGASLIGLTFNVKFWVSVKAPSKTVKLKFENPLASGSGVKVAVQFGAVPPNTILPTGIRAVFDDSADTDVVQLSTLSTSLIVKLTMTLLSSLIVWFAMTDIAGGSLTANTLKVKFLTSCKFGVPLSTNVIAKFEVPLAFGSGVSVAVQFGAVPPNTIFAIGKILRLDEVADKFIFVQSRILSTSLTVKLITNGVSSFVV